LSKTLFLSEVYKVKKRYQRSVQVALDWSNENDLDGYLLTPTARQVVKQILSGVKFEDYPKAWAITGPFGTGKSAFALFLTDLLANERPKHENAREIKTDLEITEKVFIPILMQGQRKPLTSDFIEALSNSFKNISPGFYKTLVALQNSPQDNRTVVQLFDRATQEAEKSGFSGLLVIVDEFGKYLEYAADNSDEVDLLLMQELAEASARSDFPFILITILHSAFADYLSNVDDARKAEWQKVQGRFADISFIEPGEQFLRLIGSAIRSDDQNEIVRIAQKKVGHILASTAYDEARKRMPLEELLESCVPLHPSTALLLWPLFRSALSQNERSLFSFLNDFSPYGFQDFLTKSELGQSFYHIFDLYDYITFTIGDAVLLSLQARRWAEVSNALNKIEVDAPQLASKIIKIIGLASLFGDRVGIKPTREFLNSIFEDIKAVADATGYLEKKSIIVYRKFDGAFGIWEGSDVDLDLAYNRAQIRSQQGNFAHRLGKLIEFRAIVARAHYIQTGTMRYFDVEVIDGNISALETAVNKDIKPADGKVFFVLSEKISERDLVVEKAIEITSSLPSEHRLKIFAFPKPIRGLEDALSDLEHWQWVKDNTPELAGDRVARQEVQAQIENATHKLFNVAGETLGLNGYLFAPDASIWVHSGILFEHQSGIEFQRWLSSLSTGVFYESPYLFNELINREHVSRAAAAIRRNLIQTMIEADGQKTLGFVGTPPEYSLYRSLLEKGGFYRERSSGEYSFDGLPAKEWRPVWYVMRIFLDSTKLGRRSLGELYEILKSPPIGMREGPIPILICVLLLAYRERVALYEDGRFIPEIKIEILELLIKSPETFEIQLYELAAETKEAYFAVGQALEQLDLMGSENFESSVDLLSVIKPLVVFATGLPDFTKKTKTLNSEHAVEVRDALIKARDPYTLLFETLPDVLGVSISSKADAKKFASRLKENLSVLKQAYPRLLDRIENNFREAFEEQKGIQSVSLMNNIVQRSAPLIGYTPDPTLKLFIREAGRINNRDWREVLARAVNGGLPVDKWLDRSVVDFQLHLMQLASDFKRLESLVYEKGKADDGNIILRVSMLNGSVEDSSRVLSISPEIEKDLNQLVNKLEKELEMSSEDLKLAALGKILERLIKNNEGSE
jgi:hypothetical protein